MHHYPAATRSSHTLLSISDSSTHHKHSANFLSFIQQLRIPTKIPLAGALIVLGPLDVGNLEFSFASYGSYTLLPTLGEGDINLLTEKSLCFRVWHTLVDRQLFFSR